MLQRLHWLVVMIHGKVEQIGSRQEVYDKPASPLVYQFLGNVSLFHSRVHQGKAHIGEFAIDINSNHQTNDSPATAYVGPHDIEIEKPHKT